YEASLGFLLAEGLSMDQVALGLIKLQLGKVVEEYTEQNFELDLRRGTDRPERSRSGRDRERSPRISGGRGRERSERGSERGGSSRERGKREPNMARLFLNLGKKD